MSDAVFVRPEKGARWPFSALAVGQAFEAEKENEQYFRQRASFLKRSRGLVFRVSRQPESIRVTRVA